MLQGQGACSARGRHRVSCTSLALLVQQDGEALSTLTVPIPSPIQRLHYEKLCLLNFYFQASLL